MRASAKAPTPRVVRNSPKRSAMRLRTAAGPTFRLITPSFNQARFIARTIESIRQQTYPRWTHFVADGGSTDSTVSILQRSLRPEQWRSRPDGGQTACLIEGFRQGNEEILAWVNSDDYLFPEALERVARCFQHDPAAAIVHGAAMFVDESGETLARADCVPVTARRLEERNVLYQPSTFFRRNWYERVGGLNPRLSKSFDYDLFLRIVQAGGKCVAVPDVLSAFRIHTAGQTSALWRDFLPEILAVQWRHGDRRQFARRYAEKLWLLCSGRDSMRLIDARAFLDAHLDDLLETTAWRVDAPQRRTERLFTAESTIRDILRPGGWSKRLGRLGLACSPRKVASLAYWAGNVTWTGQWRTLAENRRVAQSFASLPH